MERKGSLLAARVVLIYTEIRYIIQGFNPYAIMLIIAITSPCSKVNKILQTSIASFKGEFYLWGVININVSYS